MTQEITKTTIGTLVAEDIRRADVFHRYGLDFCCGGGKTVEAACKEKGLEADQVAKELEAIQYSGHNELSRFNQWPLDFLVDYILENHHRFMRTVMEELPPVVEKVVHNYQNNHSETVQVRNLLYDLFNEINAHLQKEEQILFPYIKQLVQAHEQNQAIGQFHCGNVNQPIRVMEHEHDSAGNMLREMRSATGNYRIPDDACRTFQWLYHKLQEIEADLHQHIHLENNILFPKAIELESNLHS